MAKSWGIARFYGMGSTEYLLESGQWLADSRLFDGAPIRLFESMAEADAYTAQLPKESQSHGVQFMLDGQGMVLTARTRQKRPTGQHAYQQHR